MRSESPRLFYFESRILEAIAGFSARVCPHCRKILCLDAGDEGFCQPLVLGANKRYFRALSQLVDCIQCVLR